SGLIIFVAACIARMIPWRGQRTAVWPAVAMLIVLAASLAYGKMALQHEAGQSGPAVALIQGSSQVELMTDGSKLREVLEEYLRLSKQALGEQANLDLLVWPETMYRYPLWTFAEGFKAPSDWARTPQDLIEESRRNLRELQDYFRHIVDEKFAA